MTTETVRLICGIGAVLLLVIFLMRRGRKKKSDLDKL
jgi:hypothetical protein